MAESRVVVVSGAIASGKTTVTRELARRARVRGSHAAAINMDDIVEIVMGDDWRAVTVTHLALGRQMAASLVNALDVRGVPVVFLAGAFFNQDDRRDFLSQLSPSVGVDVVTLQVSLVEALRRCQLDPTRTVSKDESLVRRIYAGIDWNALPSGEPIISTEGSTVAQTATQIEELLGLR